MPRLDPFGHIASRVIDTPLLIEERKARIISDYLESRFLIDTRNPPAKMWDDDDGYSSTPEKKSIARIYEGVCIIPIVGTLVHRGDYMSAMSGLVSYQTLRKELIEAANDASIKAILLDIDSGGGEAEGNFDLARLVREINDEHKPVIAISNGSAFSGAYSIGVAAGEFYVTETGGVGSVGVIMQHYDYSEMNKIRGIKVTNITAGERKDWFDPNSPLKPEAQEFLMREAKKTGDMFIAHVAVMRGLPENVVRDTQAGLIFGQDAVNIGFVDGVSTFDEILREMTETDFSEYMTSQGSDKMSFLNKDKKDKKAKIESKVAGDKPEDEVEKDPAEVEGDKPEDEMENDDAEKDMTEGDAVDDEDESDDPVERAAAISEICAKAGVANMAPQFIRSGLSLEQVKAKVDVNDQIRKTCALAGHPDMADDFIKKGVSLSKVQDTLIAMKADESGKSDISTKPTGKETVEALASDAGKVSADAPKVSALVADAKARKEKALTKSKAKK